MFHLIFLVGFLLPGSLSLRNQQPSEIQFQLQTSQIDSDCKKWLAGNGATFASCFHMGPPKVPEKQSQNSCSTNSSDYDSFCLDPCYPVIAEGYKYIVQTGTCLSYFDQFVGCDSSADCNGNYSVCDQGMCKPACSRTEDCAALNSCSASTTTCQAVSSEDDTNLLTEGSAQWACKSNASTTTKKFTLRGALYSWLTLCSKNTKGDYCMLLADRVSNPNSLTCNDTASWGCCLGTILHTYSDCLGQEFLNHDLYSCANSNALCNDLPNTTEFCASSGVEILSLSPFVFLCLILLTIYFTMS